MDDFISEDELQTFEGFLRYQAVPATSTPQELEMWRDLFDEAMRRCESSPTVGLMKLQRIPGEQKYAVAIRDGTDLWLTMWVRYSRKGEIFIMYPRGDRNWDAHARHHLDGTLHQKSHDTVGLSLKWQPFTEAFRESEHLGLYWGHGKSSRAVCDPTAFDGVAFVEPGILGLKDGSVGVDLVTPENEPTWNGNTGQRFYLRGVHQRQVFPRHGRPSVVIAIQR